MADEASGVERPLIGLLAVGLLIAAIGSAYWEPTAVGPVGMCLRGGLLLGAVWLAFPYLVIRPGNWWLLAVCGVMLYLFLRLPFPLKIVLLAGSPILLAMFWPTVRKIRDRLRR